MSRGRGQIKTCPLPLDRCRESEDENDMAKFCGKCGSKLDEATGLCPKCDAEKLAKRSAESLKEKEKQEASVKPEKPLSKREIKKQKKADKKASRKARKKEKRARWSTGKKVRRFLLKFILIVLLLTVLAAGVTGVLVYFDIAEMPAVESILKRIKCLPKYNTIQAGANEDTLLVDFNSNESYFWENEHEDVIFSVLVKGQQPDAVDLYSDSSKKAICQMFDNGKNGDLVAGDGVYSCTISVSSDLGDLSYYSKLGEHISNSVYLYFFEKPTKDSAQEIKIFQDEILEIEDAFCNNTGYIDESKLNDALKEVENYAETLYKNGDVLYYEASTSSVLLKFKNGLTYVYLPKRSGIDIADNTTNISVLTLQPCLNTYSSEINDFLKLPDSSAEQISNKLPEYSFQIENNYDNQNVTLDLIKSFSGNQVVIWHGHGAYSKSLHSYLLTGEKFDWDAWWWDPIYCLDSLQNRIVECSNGNVAFTSKYVDKYCKQMDGAFLYLAACQSGKDSALANSFINKGATTVVANSETIYTIYNLQIQNATLVNMTQRNKETGQLYTLNEALTKAKEEFGEDDSAYGDKEEIAYPMIFGGQKAESFSFYDTSSYVHNQVPSGAVKFNGHYYYVYDVDTVTDWNMAQEYCEAQGGYLATITSQEENEFLYNYIHQRGYESAYFGLTDEGSEGTWSWCNGEPLSYVNWADGEPNNENGSENYGMLYWKYIDGAWNDGDFGHMTDSGGTAFICEWGEYTTAPVDSPIQGPVRTTSDERDIVLVLDVSGSMSGTPIAETQKASTKFVNTILDEDASVGVVTYDNSAYVLSDFSVSKDSLTSVLSDIYSGGGTNIESGLSEARRMLSTSGAKKKIIVLMSDGEPNDGKDGDPLIDYADEIKNDGIIIYTLGFFESLGSYKSSAQILMEDIASDGCHYEVASADDLVFFFEDMADQINGQKYIYIRIACPVDVSVTYNEETLCSDEDGLSLRTDFGTLTFEENEDETDNDDRIKVLRLKEGADYDVKIVGTGRGIMDYTIGFMDENGDYGDFRRFENIKITKRTKIDTVASISDESVLKIDEDGDGKYDLKLRATENGYGEEVDNSIALYVIAGGSAVLLLLIIILVSKKKHKNMMEEK